MQVRSVRSKEDRKRPSVFMRLKQDESFRGVALFEPDPELKANPGYFEYYDHWDNQGNTYVPCAGQDCPFCAANDNPSTRALTAWYFPEAADVKDQIKLFTMNYGTIEDITDESEEEDGILGKKIRIKRLDDRGNYKVKVLPDKTLTKKQIDALLKRLEEEILNGKGMRAARKSVGASAPKFWEGVQEFSGYSFNRAHAASYGVLAGKMAYLKHHYPAEWFASLLDHFPERSQYLAAARGEGYKFQLPDINRSRMGFGIDKASGAIRVGMGKIKGLGPVATGEILNNQPYRTYDDLKERTTRRAVNATRLENLGRLGALETLGIKRDPDYDLIQFQLLGFTLRKPEVFKGFKPKYTAPRTSERGWRHLGRETGLDPNQGRVSVSKLFWVPTGVKLELKASPWASVKTWLLEAVDENGVKFHILGNQDRQDNAMLLKFLHKKCQGRVVCLDGMIRLPFVMNGPQAFRVFGVTGAMARDPQIFPALPEDKKFIAAIQSMRGA